MQESNAVEIPPVFIGSCIAMLDFWGVYTWRLFTIFSNSQVYLAMMFSFCPGCRGEGPHSIYPSLFAKNISLLGQHHSNSKSANDLALFFLDHSTNPEITNSRFLTEGLTWLSVVPLSLYLPSCCGQYFSPSKVPTHHSLSG